MGSSFKSRNQIVLREIMKFLVVLLSLSATLAMESDSVSPAQLAQFPLLPRYPGTVGPYPHPGAPYGYSAAYGPYSRPHPVYNHLPYHGYGHQYAANPYLAGYPFYHPNLPVEPVVPAAEQE